jgi:hypothetical protein
MLAVITHKLSGNVSSVMWFTDMTLSAIFLKIWHFKFRKNYIISSGIVLNEPAVTEMPLFHMKNIKETGWDDYPHPSFNPFFTKYPA